MIECLDAILRIEDEILSCAEERKLGFPTDITIGPGRIKIDTRWSRDPLRSNNGGEYYYWFVIENHDGSVTMRSDWSCDFAQLQEEPETFPGSFEEALAIVRHLARRQGVPIQEK